MEGNSLITVYETARKLNSSPSSVVDMVANGELKAVNKDGCSMVTAESLSKYQESKKSRLKEITKPLDVEPRHQEREPSIQQQQNIEKPTRKTRKSGRQRMSARRRSEPQDTEIHGEEWRRRVHEINRQIRALRNSLQRANTQEMIRGLKKERNKILRDNGMTVPGNSRKPFVRFVRSERPQ